MKTKPLEEADSRRKNQCSRKGKRQSTVIDLPFVLIVRPQKAQQEQDGRRCSRDSQNQYRLAEGEKPADKADGNNGEKRRKIEK
jgi:hypothetical protein